MSKILLVRHAQSANNSLPEERRVCDPGLTPLGYRQAQSLAEQLAGYVVRGLYCSPFLRSLETARLVSMAIGVCGSVHSDLFEQGGCYSGHIPGQEKGEPGLGRSQIAERYPGWQIDDRILETGWWGQPYESRFQAAERARKVRVWLEQHLVHEGNALDVLVIHADFKRLMLMELLGAAWSEQHDRQLGPLVNTGISILERCDEQWVLHSYNSVGHLKSDQLSH